jgi:DNA polymerase
MSGQLFTKILEAQGIPRKSVYITNVVKIRPPENRDPTPAEITAFRPYLDEEITTIAPKLIITLGRFSMGKFLPDVKISQVHGRLHRVLWNGRSLYVLPMYHPAAALRNPEMCRSFEQDFAKLPKILTWIDEHTQEEHWQHDVQEALLS